MFSLSDGWRSLSQIFYAILLLVFGVAFFAVQQVEGGLFPRVVPGILDVTVEVLNQGPGDVEVSLYVMPPDGDIRIVETSPSAPATLYSGSSISDTVRFTDPEQGTYLLGALVRNLDEESATVVITNASNLDDGAGLTIYVDQLYSVTSDAYLNNRVYEVNGPMVYSKKFSSGPPP